MMQNKEHNSLQLEARAFAPCLSLRQSKGGVGRVEENHPSQKGGFFLSAIFKTLLKKTQLFFFLERKSIKLSSSSCLCPLRRVQRCAPFSISLGQYQICPSPPSPSDGRGASCARRCSWGEFFIFNFLLPIGPHRLLQQFHRPIGPCRPGP